MRTVTASVTTVDSQSAQNATRAKEAKATGPVTVPETRARDRRTAAVTELDPAMGRAVVTAPGRAGIRVDVAAAEAVEAAGSSLLPKRARAWHFAEARAERSRS